jgi:hypothetical protein
MAGDVEDVVAAPTGAYRADGMRGQAVKYMLMMFGDQATMTQQRSPEWVAQMIAFMGGFNAELERTGELVEARGLADASTARTVALVDGQVVVSDGPFAEAKESLAGFWVVDVAGPDRAVELASQIVVWADRLELREVPDGPPEQ